MTEEPIKTKTFRPIDLQIRAGINPAAMHRRLRHPDCPPYETERGETGRIVYIECSKEAEAWLSRRKAQGNHKKTRFEDRATTEV